MPLRRTPTQRQRRLGAELRRLREAAGVSPADAAALLNLDRGKVSHIEVGRYPIRSDRVRLLLEAYGCTDARLAGALGEMADGDGRGWWSEFKGVIGAPGLDLAEMESRAVELRIHETLFVPGILQTPEYARAVLGEAGTPPEKLDSAVTFRMARQRILAGPAPLRFHAIIHETALQTHFDADGLMEGQLLHLVEMARLPHVTIQIFPFEAGAYSALSRSFEIHGASVPELGTVFLEHAEESVYHGEREYLRQYHHRFERLESMALPPIDPEVMPDQRRPMDSLSLIQYLLHTVRRR